MKKHLLAFVADKDGNQVFLHADLAGVEYLIKELEYLRKELKNNDCPHTHLFSEDWGSGELSTSTMLNKDAEGLAVHHLKMYGWNNEWVKKHGFKRS
jgi:hypothetical protein